MKWRVVNAPYRLLLWSHMLRITLSSYVCHTSRALCTANIILGNASWWIVTNCVDYRLTIVFSINDELIKRKKILAFILALLWESIFLCGSLSGIVILKTSFLCIKGLIKSIFFFLPQNRVKYQINIAFVPYNSQIIFVVFFVMGKIRLHWVSFVYVCKCQVT